MKKSIKILKKSISPLQTQNGRPEGIVLIWTNWELSQKRVERLNLHNFSIHRSPKAIKLKKSVKKSIKSMEQTTNRKNMTDFEKKIAKILDQHRLNCRKRFSSIVSYNLIDYRLFLIRELHV